MNKMEGNFLAATMLRLHSSKLFLPIVFSSSSAASKLVVCIYHFRYEYEPSKCFCENVEIEGKAKYMSHLKKL